MNTGETTLKTDLQEKISEELQKIIDTISAQGEMKFLESATDEKIAAFEKEHNIKLPTKYREWLKFSDGGEIFLPAGIQFYGVEHKPIIDVEDDDRLDDSYIVIGTLASGDPIVFKKTEERISIYNLEDDRIEADETYKDFYAFLNDTHDMLGIGDQPHVQKNSTIKERKHEWEMQENKTREQDKRCSAVRNL